MPSSALCTALLHSIFYIFTTTQCCCILCSLLPVLSPTRSLCSPPPLLLPPTSSSSASLHNHLHLASPTSILCCSNFKELVWIEYWVLCSPSPFILFAHCVMYYFYICIQLCCSLQCHLLSCSSRAAAGNHKNTKKNQPQHIAPTSMQLPFTTTTTTILTISTNNQVVYECYTYTLTKNTAISTVTPAMIAAMLVPPQHSSYSCYDCGWWLLHTLTAMIGYDCYATLVHSWIVFYLFLFVESDGDIFGQLMFL